MNRGELWWLEEPAIGRRPACVLSRGEALPVLRRVLVVPATRTIRDIPTEVVLEPDEGVPARCALSLDSVTSVPKALLTERITMLSGSRLAELCAALRVATGC